MTQGTQGKGGVTGRHAGFRPGGAALRPGLALRAAAAPAMAGLAWQAGWIHGPWPLLAALLFGGLLYASQAASRRSAPWYFAAAGALFLAFGLSLVPGFGRLDLGPVSVNTGKALAGLAAAVMLPSAWRWNRACTVVAGACLVGVPALAWAIGYVHWGPAPLRAVALFAVGNAFGTLAEEWFFRRWVQQPLQRWGAGFAVGVTAVLFGLAHLGGGTHFALLATLAGLAYGAVFHLSRGSVWASVALHLGLNVLRRLLFGL
ncbi:CPBP family intramembrane metalloprotease [Aquabacterium sp. A7-Y]|uniref:CPBP family intramembrane glutamic endopeptidase n=1 Tax=Aquabacterium sp. A7-Y TaxID=1349605 RepID=UPI00223D99B3|nr:CPBP family intramembrane glutamic endopeptidase [Aquabacterium sp. A7-Y]MCW7538679.1 CPBP family intramembrane metalloprotease [Aquabacterium sp. A7-Y]